MPGKEMTVRLILFLGFVVVGIFGIQSLFDQVPSSHAEFSARVSHQLPPAMNRCASCHQDVCEEFNGAPHSQTLWEASDPLILGRFAGRDYQIAEDGPTVRFEERNQQLWMTSDAYPEAMQIQWMFGSGQHAMTPVSLMSNPDGSTELIEGSVSWFPPNDLGPTPGADLTGAPGVRSLGEPIDHATTMECFGCHVTHLPHDDGRILETSIFKGVSCERCHTNGDDHIAAIELGAAGSMEKWSELSPLESINRCGECHRRADQLTPSELSAERPVLVRFAPVGLAMSPCFTKQDSLVSGGHSFRMDCMTCHDPHQPAEKSADYYVAKCLHCHGSADHQAPVCSSETMTAECLKCHMPPVSITKNLKLTDHWIRIRTSSDLPAALP